MYHMYDANPKFDCKFNYHMNYVIDVQKIEYITYLAISNAYLRAIVGLRALFFSNNERRSPWRCTEINIELTILNISNIFIMP